MPKRRMPKNSKVKFTNEEINKIINLTGGYTSFFQAACFFLYDSYSKYNIRDSEKTRWSYVEENFNIELRSHFAYFWNKSRDEEKILLSLFVLSKQKDRYCITEDRLNKIYPGYKNYLECLHDRSLIIKKDKDYCLFSPAFVDWIIKELTDISKKDEKPFEEWLRQYKKGFFEKGIQNIESEIEKVNPRYWELLVKAIDLVKDPKVVLEIIDKIGKFYG